MYARHHSLSRRLLVALSIVAMLAALMAISGGVAAGEEPGAPQTAGEAKAIQPWVNRTDLVADLDCKQFLNDVGGCSVNIFGFKDELTTVTVYQTDAMAVQLFSETITPTETAHHVEAGNIMPGNHVVAAAASETVEYTAGAITAEIDWENDIVSGTTDSTDRIDVWPFAKELFHDGQGSQTDVCARLVYPDADGTWSADFSTPADPLNQDECQAPGAATTFDFGPGDIAMAFAAVSTDPVCGANCLTHTTTLVRDFVDDDGSTFELDITWLADEGITAGCNPPDNDMFCPNDYVTRGQMAAFLVRAMGYTDGAGANLFTDDDGSIFETNIDKLGTAGVTAGCNPPINDLFCPNDYVTRGQMAAFLVRAMGFTDGAGANLFTDDDGSIFETNIDKLGTAGVTRGCNPPTNDLFCPNDYVTRGQMAAFLRRALG